MNVIYILAILVLSYCVSKYIKKYFFDKNKNENN